MKKHIERERIGLMAEADPTKWIDEIYVMDEEKVIFNGEGLMSKIWPGLSYEANKARRLEQKREELKRMLLRSLECADQIQDIVECNKRMIW